jgi:hypothetical protein
VANGRWSDGIANDAGWIEREWRRGDAARRATPCMRHEAAMERGDVFDEGATHVHD